MWYLRVVFSCGVAWCVSGNLYNGEWREDRRHGQGTFSFVSGEL